MQNAQSPPKKKKIKVPRVVNGQDTLVEIEVEDVGGLTWGARGSHKLLNTDLERLDGPAKASGMAKYTYDVRVPGMLYGRILHSPHASADIVSVDTSAAEKMSGVKAVINMGKREAKYEGDPIAAVAAITPEIAEDAIRAIKVEYKKRPHAVTYAQAIKPDAPEVFKRGAKGNVQNDEKRGDMGDVDKAFAQCDAVVEAEYEITMQHHVCLETHGVVVDYRGGDKATVYASTQWTFSIPGEAASQLGLKAPNVESVVEHMGGGFGSKFGLMLPGGVACQLSKQAKAPVKLMFNRPEEFLMGGNRNGALQKVKAGASKDGKLLALRTEQFELGGLGQGGLAGLPYIYQVQNVYRDKSHVNTNQDASLSMRGPGHPQVSFAMESLVDDLAAKINMDPIEFRKKNTDNATFHRQLDMGAKELGWEKRPKTPGGGELSGKYKSCKRGMGCGMATWGGSGGPSNQVDVFIKSDGTIVVQVGSQDLGTGTRTYMSAIVAEEFGLPLKAVEAKLGRSTYGASNPSGGSTTTASLAPAVKDAAYNARLLMFARVAPALQAKPEDLIAEDGKIYAKQAPNKALTWKQACATLGASGLAAHGEWKPDLSGNGVHGVQLAEVEVDLDTGQVRVLKMVGVQDCGLPLNRRAVQSQLNGGMIQALGYALLEKHVVDEFTGNMLNLTMDEYKIPGCLEMPEMIPLIDDGDTRDVVIGMAEPAAIPGASAIANAVYNACGVRVNSLPITPDKILDGLEALRQKKV